MTRDEFILRRQCGIGGSDIGAICGVSPWKSPLDVYRDKVAEPESIINNEAFPVGETKSLYWGSVHEAAIADAYTIVTDTKLMRYNRLITHPEKPYFIANVDRLAYCADGSRPFNTKTGEIFTDTGIEIKTARFKDDEWGDEGTDDVPAQYLLHIKEHPDCPEVHCAISCRIGSPEILVVFSDRAGEELLSYRESITPAEVITAFRLREPRFADMCRNGLFS